MVHNIAPVFIGQTKTSAVGRCFGDYFFAASFFFEGSKFRFLPSITPLLIRRLNTVSDGFAPTESQCNVVCSNGFYRLS